MYVYIMISYHVGFQHHRENETEVKKPAHFHAGKSSDTLCNDQCWKPFDTLSNDQCWTKRSVTIFDFSITERMKWKLKTKKLQQKHFYTGKSSDTLSNDPHWTLFWTFQGCVFATPATHPMEKKTAKCLQCLQVVWCMDSDSHNEKWKLHNQVSEEVDKSVTSEQSHSLPRCTKEPQMMKTDQSAVNRESLLTPLIRCDKRPP